MKQKRRKKKCWHTHINIKHFHFYELKALPRTPLFTSSFWCGTHQYNFSAFVIIIIYLFYGVDIFLLVILMQNKTKNARLTRFETLQLSLSILEHYFKNIVCLWCWHCTGFAWPDLTTSTVIIADWSNARGIAWSRAEFFMRHNESFDTLHWFCDGIYHRNYSWECVRKWNSIIPL